MEVHALSVVSTNIKQSWGLLIALIVSLTLCLRLAASHPHTVLAQKAFICQTTDESAWDVHQDPHRKLRASRSSTASATRDGRGKTVSVLAVWLANIKRILHLMHALPVPPGNIRTLSVHPHTPALTVQRARTRQTTGQSVRFVGTRPRHVPVPALCPVPAMLASQARTAPCACCAPRASTGSRTSGTTGPGRAAMRGRRAVPLRRVLLTPKEWLQEQWMETTTLISIIIFARKRFAQIIIGGTLR